MSDFNSSANQNIKRKFVEREIYCCLSDMVEALINAEKFDIYDYLQWYGTLENGDEYTEQERDEKLEELNELLENTGQMDANDVAEIEAKITELENMDLDQLPEVFEWWGVSDWFAEKLDNYAKDNMLNGDMNIARMLYEWRERMFFNPVLLRG